MGGSAESLETAESPDTYTWPADQLADHLDIELERRGRIVVPLSRINEIGPILRAINNCVLYGRNKDGSETAFRGVLVCEACRAIFAARNRRLNDRVIRCPACAEEKRANLAAHRRRGARAWWRDQPETVGLEPCVGCVALPDRNPRGGLPDFPQCVPAMVPGGTLYCSDRCRKRVDRYLARGGWIQATRGGLPVSLR